ncbi:MAG: ABC transporter ATP-binding protein [Mycoplasmataceae bacterium]|nr:ABC transporter ATP-binding protein [Mycoplasmataceae bacterium]
MNKPIHGEEINKVLLKPRFKMEFDESQEEILDKFKENLNDKDCQYCSKQSGNHIFLDVPKAAEHFWSPQLQVEVIKGENNKTIVKGILGPKPQVWTMFMFFHFALALAFIVFFVLFYVKWSLEKVFQFYKYMLLTIPIIWVIMYFVGQAGKKIAYKQMVELDDVLMSVLKK